MKNPWVGQEIWNKVYKGKMLNGQGNSREIREMKKSEETVSKKEEEAIKSEKKHKEMESKKDGKSIILGKESEETGLKKEEKPIKIEKNNKETESNKEEKTIVLEKESGETRLKKEEKAIKSEKKSKETESNKEEKTIKSEKKNKKTDLNKEEKKIEFEKQSDEKESKKESIDLGTEIGTSVRSIEVKTPFSIISDVTSFIKFPNMNVKNQEVFVFRNQKDERNRELDAKLLTTVQHYHGEVTCNLVSSNLYEKRVLLELSNQKINGDMEENWGGTSSWIPIHGIILEKEDEVDINNYINAKLPIEIGRYKGEISLQEKVIFKEKIIGIKEVSQEVILTKKEFLLPNIIKQGNNPSIIEKGSLLIEGYIYQCIKFISEQSTSHDKLYQLVQNIVLELTVQLLQEQEIRVRIT
ncbi:BC_2427 family protein [Bacillus toyonensis]|uniref:BC_2427 family protein n=1 Tax=Bacillus toyonensis TaxID=155322 RepID=UPI002175E3B9|nr:hypothetical protein [Bacillus toyonensis]